MTSRNISWVPGVHVRFGNLDFVVMMEGELVRPPIAAQPLHFTGLNAIIEALEELRQRAPEALAPESGQLLDFDYGRHYWIQVLCRVPEALGKGQIALGKAFAECGTRQRTHGKKLIGKTLGDTRQRKATVTLPVPLRVTLPSANP